jgi:hypothetical protein
MQGTILIQKLWLTPIDTARIQDPMPRALGELRVEAEGAATLEKRDDLC